MAFVDYSVGVGEEGKEKFPYIYNVSFSVGFAGISCRDDVMLVQYLLKKIWERSYHPPPDGTMLVDGWMGPITDRWIRRFQKGDAFDVPEPGLMLQDGIVDSARGSTYASNTGLCWSIVYMNVRFKYTYPELYDRLPTAPDLPPLLAHSLATNIDFG